MAEVVAADVTDATDATAAASDSEVSQRRLRTAGPGHGRGESG